MTLGDRIQRLRKSAGLSQEELSDRLGVTRQSVSLWETNQTVPSLDNIIALSRLFGVSTDELLGEKALPAPAEEQVAAEKPIASGTTEYRPKLFFKLARLGFKRSEMPLVLSGGALTLFFIVINFFDTDPYMGAGVVGLILLIFWLVRRSAVKRAAEVQAANYPNLTWNFAFFADRLTLQAHSERSLSTYVIPYAAIAEVAVSDRYLILYCPDRIAYVDKTALSGDVAQVVALLRGSVFNYDSAKSPARNERTGLTFQTEHRLKIALLVLFIATLLSPVLALVLAAPSMDAGRSGAWGFAVAGTIPLASLALGIYGKVKKLKATKNIVAGTILIVSMLGWASGFRLMQTMTTEGMRFAQATALSAHVELPKIWTASVNFEDGVEYGSVIIDDEAKMKLWQESLAQNGWQESASQALLDLYPAQYRENIRDCEYYYCYDIINGLRVDEPAPGGAYYCFAFDQRFRTVYIVKSPAG